MGKHRGVVQFSDAEDGIDLEARGDFSSPPPTAAKAIPTSEAEATAAANEPFGKIRLSVSCHR